MDVLNPYQELCAHGVRMQEVKTRKDKTMLPVLRRIGGSLEPTAWMDRELDRTFNSVWGNIGHAAVGGCPVDIWEDGENVYVEAEMPGFNKDQISVTLECSILSITAQRSEDHDQRSKHVSERHFASIGRSFKLPMAVVDLQAEAKLEHGVLHLRLPKSPKVKPKKIKID